VLFAFLISAPLGWWFLNSFLERYPYRVEVSWWALLSAGLMAFVLAITIVSAQALRAAISNPVNSLRSE
jgi:putative ABC transport system permease protein